MPTQQCNGAPSNVCTEAPLRRIKSARLTKLSVACFYCSFITTILSHLKLTHTCRLTNCQHSLSHS